MDTRLQLVISLKSGTADGEIKDPLAPPRKFKVAVPICTKSLLMRRVKEIVKRGERPVMQISLCYHGGIEIAESSMAPVIYLDVRGAYPLRSDPSVAPR